VQRLGPQEGHAIHQPAMARVSKGKSKGKSQGGLAEFRVLLIVPIHSKLAALSTQNTAVQVLEAGTRGR